MLSLAQEGHPAIAKMNKKYRDIIWWPGISKEIEQFVFDCIACSLFDESVKPVIPSMTSISLQLGPRKKMLIDVFGEVKASPSHQEFVK